MRLISYDSSVALLLALSVTACVSKDVGETGGTVDGTDVDDTGETTGDDPPPDPGDAVVVETTVGSIFAAYPDLGSFPAL